jgi:hypothetical protein
MHASTQLSFACRLRPDHFLKLFQPRVRAPHLNRWLEGCSRGSNPPRSQPSPIQLLRGPPKGLHRHLVSPNIASAWCTFVSSRGQPFCFIPSSAHASRPHAYRCAARAPDGPQLDHRAAPRGNTKTTRNAEKNKTTLAEIGYVHSCIALLHPASATTARRARVA